MGGDKAFDGNNETFWQAGSGILSNSWIMVDFNEVKTLTSLTYTEPTTQSSTCCYQTGAASINIQTSNDGISWDFQDVISLNGSVGSTKTYDFAESYSTQYLRINVYNNRGNDSALRIYEMNVNGY